MKPENQHIELMKFMGWKVCPCFGKWHDPNDEIKPLPPLTLDLMHEAEMQWGKRCTIAEWKQYGEALAKINKTESWTCHETDAATVTKEQKLEVFLKVPSVGLWGEE